MKKNFTAARPERKKRPEAGTSENHAGFGATEREAPYESPTAGVKSHIHLR